MTAGQSLCGGRSDSSSRTIAYKTSTALVSPVGPFPFLHGQIRSRSAKPNTGFYYVCVDFNQQPQTPTSHHMPLIRETDDMNTDANPDGMPDPVETLAKPESPRRSRRHSIDREGRFQRGLSRSSSRSGSGPLVATMSGFYFHQNSEP